MTHASAEDPDRRLTSPRDGSVNVHHGRHAAASPSTGEAAPAVVAHGLVKRYKEVTALDGVDLVVPTGTVLGLLGPNGAGKTTTVRILATLLRPDSGHAEVAGIDVLADPAGVRKRIGLSGQYAAVDEYLTGYENLDMIGRLYHLGRTQSRARARELLAQFGLEDAGDRPTRTYSGGMRRRLDLAGALVARPPVIFLDEPTTGLDPRGRTEMWDVIRSLVAEGTTLLLTTQYLEEADLLADEVVVIDRGRVIARGTSDELKRQIGGDRLEVTVADGSRLEDARALLEPLGVGGASLDPPRRGLSLAVSNGAAGVLTEALRRLDDAGIGLDDVGMHRPTLDDVFLTLTGQKASGDGEDDDSSASTSSKSTKGASR